MRSDSEPEQAIAHAATQWQRRLPETVLPYWLGRSRDDIHGGYLLPDDVVRSWLRRTGRQILRSRRVPLPEDKQLVTQARLLWVFSHVHRQGIVGDEYLDAASSGYTFLVDHFLDQIHGGYHWITDRAGRTVNPVKHLYGQAFVIYGLVEYSRASGEPAALDHALDLHRAVDEHLHDDGHGGWREHGDVDWRPVVDDDPRIEVPFPGRKSGNSIIHWIEGLAELADATGDARVRRSLAEAVDCASRALFPTNPATTNEPCLPDWSPDPAIEHLTSYGHNVEFVWLLNRAQQVLGATPAWDRYRDYVDHALRWGFDHRRGGAYAFGRGDEPAHVRHKLAWVQCELVAALTDALLESENEEYTRALAKTLAFVDRHMIDPNDGVMLESVRANGRRRWPRKSGDWKVGYHEVRAWTKLVGAFAPWRPH